MFMAFWNYNYFDNYMASRLYKTYSPKEERKESEFMKPWPFFNQKEYCQSLLPECLLKRLCRCCRQSRKERAFQIAREKMIKEISIIEIIKSRRLFNAALKLLLRREQRLKLKDKSRYISINPDSDLQTSKKKKDEFKDEVNHTDGFYSSSS